MAALSASGGKGTWVKTGSAWFARSKREPEKVAIVADQKDAWTLSKNVELGAVWLIRKGNAVNALAVVCPHLGCSVNAEADGSFGCPCHTSVFDHAGKKVSGPSPRDMGSARQRKSKTISFMCSLHAFARARKIASRSVMHERSNIEARRLARRTRRTPENPA